MCLLGYNENEKDNIWKSILRKKQVFYFIRKRKGNKPFSFLLPKKQKSFRSFFSMNKSFQFHQKKKNKSFQPVIRGGGPIIREKDNPNYIAVRSINLLFSVYFLLLLCMMHIILSFFFFFFNLAKYSYIAALFIIYVFFPS